MLSFEEFVSNTEKSFKEHCRVLDENRILHEQLRLLKLQKYGKKKETAVPATQLMLNLVFNEAEQEAKKQPEKEPKIAVKAHLKSKSKKRLLTLKNYLLRFDMLKMPQKKKISRKTQVFGALVWKLSKNLNTHQPH